MHNVLKPEVLIVKAIRITLIIFSFHRKLSLQTVLKSLESGFLRLGYDEKMASGYVQDIPKSIMKSLQIIDKNICFS